MAKLTHPIYKDYPEQPYISPDRDLGAWEKTSELFPYGVVEKKQMQRLPEAVLPGHIIMLWRIHFGNFTNKTIIPQYFEYRYGVDSDECIQTLIALGYTQICSAKDSLPSLNVKPLKQMLQKFGLNAIGKKDELVQRLQSSVSEEDLAREFTLRRYHITPTGEQLLKKYDAIVQRHGPKM